MKKAIIPTGQSEFNPSKYINTEIVYDRDKQGTNLPMGPSELSWIETIYAAEPTTENLEKLIDGLLNDYLKPYIDNDTPGGDDQYFDYTPDAFDQVFLFAAQISYKAYYDTLDALSNNHWIHKHYIQEGEFCYDNNYYLMKDQAERIEKELKSL